MQQLLIVHLVIVWLDTQMGTSLKLKCAACRTGKLNPVLAETVGIKEALSWMKEMGRGS